jgi:hypothetical protein
MRAAVPWWVDPLMRFGYAARGVVYVLVGVLAFIAAIDGGAAPDSKDALQSLLDKPFGKSLLVLIALGLMAYAAWRFIDAAFDLERKGDEPSGWAARAGQIISGVLHLSLAVTAFATIGLVSGSGGGDGAEGWTAKLMDQPFGRWLVALVGLIAIAFAVNHFIKAYREKYKEELRYTTMAARLDGLVKFGLIAHGLVVLIVGVFFLWAAWTADPSRAGGLGEALNTVREATFGRIMLAVLALGLLGFSVYCFIEATFRVVPRCAPADLQTLATHARTLGRRANAAVTGR